VLRFLHLSDLHIGQARHKPKKSIAANNFIGSIKNIPKEHWYQDLKLEGE
jgi:hypothetical protein